MAKMLFRTTKWQRECPFILFHPNARAFLGSNSRPVSRGTQKNINWRTQTLYTPYTIPLQTPILIYIYAFQQFKTCVSRETAPFSSTNTTHIYDGTKIQYLKAQKRNIRTLWHNRRVKTTIKTIRTQRWLLESSNSQMYQSKALKLPLIIRKVTE